MNTHTSHFMKYTGLSLLGASLLFCPIGIQSLQSAVSQEDLSYKAYSNPFIQASKKASPSVVSIKTLINPSQGQQNLDEQTMPSPDEFWEHFFGVPNFPGMLKMEKKPEYIFGSGFIVSADGYILTNNHMVEHSTKITVQLQNGQEFTAKKIGADASTDIALIKIDGNNLPPLTLADSSKVDIGEWVLAIGNPLGLRESVSAGVISAKGRSDLDITMVEEFFQTDATINRGNSGGPLVNLNGDVIGMNTAIATTTGGYMGIGFAISSNLLKDVMQELKDHGKLNRGFLGVALQPIDSDLANALGLDNPHGALISEVMKDSPAEAGGLKSGDVITQVNGVTIETAGGLRKSIALMRPGQKVSLTIIRSGKVMNEDVTIGSFPDGETKAASVQDAFGMTLETISPDVAKRYQLSSALGVLVVQVDPMGAGYAAGLRPGNIIMSVNGTRVSTVEEFSTLCSSLEKGKRALLQIKAGKQTRYISLIIE